MPRLVGRFVWLALLWVLAACHAAPVETPFVLAGSLPITAPRTAVVGEPVVVTVGPVAAPDHTAVTLTAVGSYGPIVLRSTFLGGSARFQIPPELATHSGAVTLLAASGSARGQANLDLRPQEPIEPITPLVGARSIIADGGHYAMSVVVPFDRFGNPVAEGTMVHLRILHPGSVLQEIESPVRHLLAWERVYSRTIAGRTLISAEVEGQHGPESTLEEIAGWPVPFALTAEPASLPADGFQLLTLRSDVIRDRFGNLMPDGTEISFVAAGPAGDTRIIPAQTLDGVAEAVMQAPSIPGVYQVQATVLGMTSAPLRITFTPGPAVGGFPVHVAVDSAQGTLRLTAGPITAVLQQYVPDGAPVGFTITGPDGQMWSDTAVTAAGYASIEMRLTRLTSGAYTAVAAAGSGRGTTRFSVP